MTIHKITICIFERKKIMELELKHLAPYLPYGLKVMYTHGGKIGEIKSLLDISEYDDIKIIMDYQDGEHIWMFQPILRPLSDLTKEITHDGIRFEPSYWFEICDDENDSLEFDFGNIKLIKQIEGIAQDECNHDLQFLPYFVINKLIEWHFDVFGLIPAGLAIDINTINKKTP